MTWLTALGLAALAAVKWEDVLPPSVGGKVLFGALGLLVIGLGVAAAYRLQKRLDQLRDRIYHDARLPQSQRERVHRIKQTAGTILADLEEADPDQAQIERLLSDLDRDRGGLMEHSDVARIAQVFSGTVKIALVDASYRIPTKKRPHVHKLLPGLHDFYKGLVGACNTLLESHPASSADTKD